jgi:hypothetical protein
MIAYYKEIAGKIIGNFATHVTPNAPYCGP